MDETSLSGLAYAILTPLNIGLMVVCIILLYKICKPQTLEANIASPSEPQLPKMKRKDFTVEELHKFDGLNGDGRILIAVNGKVFDVTKGKRFYGPTGAYGVFAGRDASRGLAKFRIDKETVKDEYDDLSDLKESELSEMREWELQFSGKFVKINFRYSNY